MIDPHWSAELARRLEPGQLERGDLRTARAGQAASIKNDGKIVQPWPKDLPVALIGFAHNTFSLLLAITLFAFTTRIFNISVNTQALTLSKRFEKKIL